MIEDFDRCYRAAQTKDSRFDGVFFGAVTSTGIYCRPSCPAITPKRSNMRFFATAAAAQAAGFRACKRCRPDASPGSPEWNIRADVVARAMRLIADGIVDREGVSGLATRLHFSDRHLHRLLLAEVGAGPQALARAHRAQTARVLIETTSLPFTEIAFAAGFASIRQFNDTIRQVFESTPTELRTKRRRYEAPSPGLITLRLPYRKPFHTSSLFEFLSARAVRGVEESQGNVYRRSLRLPRSSGIVELEDRSDHVRCSLKLDDMRDLASAVGRCRALLDLDADPVGVDKSLKRDPLLRPMVRRAPGRRVPGAVDGHEMAFRAVIGQQISVAGARTLTAKLVEEFGKPLTTSEGGVTHLFPEAAVIAENNLETLGFPATRRGSLKRLASALADGEIELDRGADRDEARSKLMALPGIGLWTASYIGMRALGDPDAFPATDLGVKRALERLGENRDPESIAERWRPWRAYALQHLWGSLSMK